MTCFPRGLMRLSKEAVGRYLLAIVIVAMGALVAQADPQAWRQQGWKTDFSRTAVPFEEIVSGGPPKDGIPSIDKPAFVPAAAARGLEPAEAVIGLAINGDARAYPLRILIWHEIVNDTVGGVPVAVTYCPLCNSAIVFERRVGNRELTFGTTGKLRHSDLVMYDRQTESWWQQFTGRGIVGHYTGHKLKLIPARLESLERFKARHPNGKVLVPNDPQMRPYGSNPYVGYDRRSVPYPLYQGDLPEDIDPMARVVVVKTGDGPQAVTLSRLRRERKLMLGDIELSWEPGQASALDAGQVAKGRDVGNVIAQRRKGSQVVDVPYDVTFAFVFHAFHPDRTIIR